MGSAISVITMLFLGVLIIFSILIIIVPIIDQVLTSEWLGFFNDVSNGLSVFLGSDAMNIILVLLGLVFFLYFLKFVFSKLSPIGK